MTQNAVRTFGDVRRLVLDTLVDLKSGSIDVNRAMAIAANVKVLNDNVQVEINAAKLAIATEGKAHQFGRVVQMGQTLIGNDSAPQIEN